MVYCKFRLELFRNSVILTCKSISCGQTNANLHSGVMFGVVLAYRPENDHGTVIMKLCFAQSV